MTAETILDGIVIGERLVTHDTNPFAGRCQHVPVFRLWSALWLLMLEVRSRRAYWTENRKSSDLRSSTQVRRTTKLVPPCLNSHCEELWLRDTTA